MMLIEIPQVILQHRIYAHHEKCENHRCVLAVSVKGGKAVQSSKEFSKINHARCLNLTVPFHFLQQTC